MRAFFKLTPCYVAGLLLVAAGGAAQAVDLAPGASKGGSSELGTYAGVKPGGDQRPSVPAKPGATPAAITWPGFQMRPDGGSRVFLQSTAPVATQTQNTGGEIVIDLGDARIAGDNNARPIDTRFFNTPVTRIALKRSKGRLQLVLDLRAPATPSLTHERASSGFHFVYIDFPAGNYIDAPVNRAPPPMPDEPTSQKPPSQREVPSHLDGEAKASGKLKASGKAQTRTGGGKAEGKAGGKVEGKAGFSL